MIDRNGKVGPYNDSTLLFVPHPNPIYLPMVTLGK